MTAAILIQVLLFALALSMDAFAVSITDGLLYRDINKKKTINIAATFGLLQGLMPLGGYWLVELIIYFLGHNHATSVGNIISTILTWISFSLLLLISLKMFYEGYRSLNKKNIEEKTKLFSFKEVFLMGIATAIDAFAVGVSLRAGISNNSTIFIHITIIAVITFLMSLMGVTLGHLINKVIKGKYEIVVLFGGLILTCLSIWVVLSHYFL